MKVKPLISTNIRLSDKQRKLLKKVAKVNGLTMAEMVRKILDEALK